MTDATNADSATFTCNGFAGRNLNIEVSAEAGDYKQAEQEAQQQAEEQLEALGIDPSTVLIEFDEIVEVDDE
ncbi:hypothetical protein [Haloarcula sp. K1]|uniref:hypothetical protein n=1 Tax=Haloarcula sp. K1 TaxID=1622207 RepID=UPI0007BB8390|nr:hypothetical protein [Haloarcula sp. K1]KZX46269.1 hypothetical protein AV929_15980 [Haloarcula sp. K1]